MTCVVNKVKIKEEGERKGKEDANKRSAMLHWKLVVKRKKERMHQLCRQVKGSKNHEH